MLFGRLTAIELGDQYAGQSIKHFPRGVCQDIRHADVDAAAAQSDRRREAGIWIETDIDFRSGIFPYDVAQGVADGGFQPSFRGGGEIESQLFSFDHWPR